MILKASFYDTSYTAHKVAYYRALRILSVRILLLLCLIWPMTLIHAATPKITDGELHTVSPRSGDALHSFLARYEMTAANGMKQAFLELNNLTSTSYLFMHKKYTLPIHLYNYNGKSIRSTLGIDDWKKAVRIKEYNEALLDRGVRSTHFTSSKILWVPSPELDKEKPIAVTTTTDDSDTKSNHTTPSPTPIALQSFIHDHLYGKKYAKVDFIDQDLQGKVFYVVSGHGGPDPGALCTDCSSKLCEDEYAYDVGLRLARKLRAHGAKVEMVVIDKNDGIRDQSILKCDSDERMADNAKLPINQLKRLQQRTNYINQKWKAYKKQGLTDQYVISIHIDSNNSSHKQDVFFCYAKGSNSSRALAADLRDKFSDKYKQHQKNKNYKGYLDERGFWVLRKTAPPAVLVELANIKNRNNHKRILSSENREALAKWLYEGLAEHATGKKIGRELASSD